jgi:hypothetical protein
MKKNVMLKIASVLMVAVLLTTCAISSTFAKYVTSEETVSSNLGTVAKWGVEISGAAKDVELFKDTYSDVSKNATVMSGATDKIAVVAPGTDSSNSAFALSIKGQPEVACAVTFKGDVKLTGWMVPSSDTIDDEDLFYCPIVFSVNGEKVTTTATKGTEYSKAVMDAIAEAIFGKVVTANEDGEYIVKYPVNHDFNKKDSEGNIIGTTVTISWAWEFPETEDKEIDRKDTYLGDQAANNKASTIQISYSLGVEQIAEGVAVTQGN